MRVGGARGVVGSAAQGTKPRDSAGSETARFPGTAGQGRPRRRRRRGAGPDWDWTRPGGSRPEPDINLNPVNRSHWRHEPLTRICAA